MVKHSSSRERIGWGVEPSYAGSLAAVQPTQLRFVSHTLEQQSESIVSPEIDPTAQVLDTTRVFLSVTGQIETVMSLNSFEVWFKHLMRSATAFSGTATVGPATNISFNKSSTLVDNSINGAGNNLAPLTQGKMILISGGVNDKVVTKVIAHISDNEVITSGPILLFAAAGPSITITVLDDMTNGTTLNSLALESEFLDLPGEFQLFPGIILDTLSMTIRPRQLIQATWGVLGQRMIPGTATAFGVGPILAASTSPLINGVASIIGFFEGGPSGDSTEKLSIASVSNSTPVAVVTLANHRLETGDYVEIDSVAGAGAVDVNQQVFQIVKVNPTAFSLKTLAGVAVATTGAKTAATGVVRRLSRAVRLTSYTMNWSNNLLGTELIGTLGYDDVIANVFSSSIAGEMYFENSGMLRKFIDHDRVQDETALYIAVRDQDGRVFVIDNPRVRLTTGPVPNPGVNQPKRLSFTGQALRHTEEGITTRMARKN